MDEEQPPNFLSSLKGIDARRIVKWADYLGEHGEFIAAVVLTEDAAIINKVVRYVLEV